MEPRLKPGTASPILEFETLSAGQWSLDRTRPRALDLIAVYRGLFCPYCRAFISDLARRSKALNERGIDPVIVSMDDAERARKASAEWDLGEITVGFGLTLEAARRWNVFITQREQDNRLTTFCEPAVFLVRPDKRLFAMLLQSIPSGRPDLDNLLQGIDYLAEHGYPIRGSA
jgi:peroxiredoxin